MGQGCFFHRTVVSASLLAAVAFALPAQAESEPQDPAGTSAVDQARKHFGQGLKLYKDGDFDAALVQFERAYAAKPNFKVLYNIAQCHFELHQYVEARNKLSQYLKDGEGSIDADRRTAVQNDLNDLERRIAHLKLKVNVTGATVYIDGKKTGVTPLAGPVDVNEGQRTVSVETRDLGSKQRVVQLAGGDQQTIAIDFDAPVGPGALTPSAAPREYLATGPGTGLPAAFWITGVGALALGAGAGVTGYLALSAQHDHEDQLQRFGVTQSDLDDSSARAKGLALATDILAGAAVVSAGIATVLLITHDSGPQQLGVRVGPGGVALDGRF